MMIRNSLLLNVILAVLALSPLCHAQNEEPPSLDSVIALVRDGMQANKTTIVGEAMDLNDKDAAAFWPIYRQYEYERSRLDDGRVDVIKEYAEKYPDLTDAEAEAMADRMFECDSRLAALKKRYFKKFNKVLPALMVTKFFQLERRIDLMMDLKVEFSLPPLTQAKFAGQRGSTWQNRLRNDTRLPSHDPQRLLSIAFDLALRQVSASSHRFSARRATLSLDPGMPARTAA